MLIHNSELLLFHGQKLSQCHRSVNTRVEVVSGRPVSLFICNVAFDGFTAENVVSTSFLEEGFRLSKYGRPVLNNCDVFIEVLTIRQGIWEVFEDVTKSADTFYPLSIMDINQSLVGFLSEVLRTVVARFDLFEMVSASHSVDKAGSEVRYSHDVKSRGGGSN